MAFGAAIGVGLALAFRYLLRHLDLEYRGLYPVLTIGFVLLTFAGTNLVGGNGFLAVYVAGIALSNGNFIQRRSIIRFHEGLAWLMQIVMFVTLGLLVFPSHLVPVAPVSIVIVLFLMFVARPVAVLVSLAASRVGFREKVLISWVGLRGAVPIVLATFPLMAGVPAAPVYFNTVFFIVLASVLLQGTTIAFIARKLGLDKPTIPDLNPTESHLVGRGESALVTVEVSSGSPAEGRRLVELRSWPRESLILVLYRGNEFFVPDGSTALHADDRLVVLTSKATVDAIHEMVDAKSGRGL
jgi:cell volume regulation protein A